MTIGFQATPPPLDPLPRRPKSVLPERLAAYNYAARLLRPINPTPTDVLQLTAYLTGLDIEPDEEPLDDEPEEEEEPEPDSSDIALALAVELIDRWPPVRALRRFLS